MDNITEAKQIIEENIYCTIATASADGKPWISPVFFVFDDAYNIYWVSDKESRHSQLIVANLNVAITIFDSTAPEGEGIAVYIEAEAGELRTDELTAGIELLNSRVTNETFKIKDTGHVSGEGVWRIYKATRAKTWILGDGEYKNGQYVDKKIEISF